MSVNMGGRHLVPMLVVVLALAAVASGSSLRREESPSPQYQAARLDAAWRAAGSSFCQAVSKFAVDLLQFLDLEATLPCTTSSSMDAGIVVLLSDTEQKPPAEFFSLYGQAFSKYVHTVNDNTVGDEGLLHSAYSDGMRDLTEDVSDDLFDPWTDLFDDEDQFDNGHVAFGSGAGFGFQIVCAGTTLLTTGGGIGGGISGSVNSFDGAAALGGGGGMQASHGSTTVLDIGGGGGASLFDGYHYKGADDENQVGFDLDMALDKFGSSSKHAMHKCAKLGSLSVVGGGGYGAGIKMNTTKAAPFNKPLAYGGGWSFSFQGTVSSSASADDDDFDNDAGLAEHEMLRHDATLGSNSYAGAALGTAAAQCRDSCITASDAVLGGDIYKDCLCPCMKSKFVALGAGWASTLQCNLG